MDVLEAKRFELRPLRKSDVAAYTKNVNNRKIYRASMEMPFPYREEDTEDFLAKVRKEMRKKRPGRFALVIVMDGEAAGYIGFESIAQHKAELGFWLAEKHWNRGIMTEAIRLFTPYGMDRFELHRIYAYVFSFNRASMRVLEKAGYKKEGILRKDFEKDGRFYDHHVYAKVR